MSPDIQWDLSLFAQTDGVYYLTRVELPIADMPEPASMGVLLAGGLLALVRRRT